MKQLWLRLNSKLSEGEKRQILKVAQGTCNVALVAKADVPLASSHKLKTASSGDESNIRVISADELTRDPLPGECAVELTVRDRSGEDHAVQLAEKGAKYLIVTCPNWRIIPLENLIAKTRNKVFLLADVASVDEAKVALQTLELGVDGVVMSPKNTGDILQVAALLKQSHEPIELVRAKVTSIKSLSTGLRVCVDTIELMEVGEGMLVGSQSAGLFLIEAEVHKNPHVEPRPFRVNAGPVSSYVLTPGSKTRYLSELKSGDEVLLVSRSGRMRPGHIGRVKIERRPMTLVEVQFNQHVLSTIVQNAETVRLMTPNSSKSVVELKPGDEILIHVEEGGRHFGMLVSDETVIER